MNLNEIKDSMEYSFAMLYQEVVKIIGQLEEAQKTLEQLKSLVRQHAQGELDAHMTLIEMMLAIQKGESQ